MVVTVYALCSICPSHPDPRCAEFWERFFVGVIFGACEITEDTDNLSCSPAKLGGRLTFEVFYKKKSHALPGHLRFLRTL